MEQWQDIPGFEGYYQISNLGNVAALRYNKFKVMSPRTKDGYKKVTLIANDGAKKDFFVHRLVAAGFIPNSENKETVNHIDGNRANNRASNLEWNTSLENIANKVARLRKVEQVLRECLCTDCKKIILELLS